MGGQLARLKVSAASLKSLAGVVPNERSSVSWQVMSQCQASRHPPYSNEWPVRSVPAGSRPLSTALYSRKESHVQQWRIGLLFFALFTI